MRQRPLVQAAIGILFIASLNFAATFNKGSSVRAQQAPPQFCGVGEILSNGECIDVNECSLDNGGCGEPGSETGLCTNYSRSYSCGMELGSPCPPGTKAGLSGFSNDIVCIDVNECADGNNGGCSPLVGCTNQVPFNLYPYNDLDKPFWDPNNPPPGPYNTHSCGECPSGYNGNGVTCLDVNECGTNNGGCSQDAVCSNTAGSRICGCKAGFSGNGLICADINECGVGNAGCSAQSACSNFAPGFACSDCATGYDTFRAGNGVVTCTDVNECQFSNGGCDVQTGCFNTAGSRACGPCPSGFEGDGLNGCTNINECETIPGVCGNRLCIDATPQTLGAPPYVCSAECLPGYGGDQCLDVNECATNNASCSAQSVCTNNVGSFHCSDCPTGFTTTRAANGVVTCTDVNECSTNNGGCSQDAVCSNTLGSRTCACNSGFSGTGLQCTDVNECMVNNGGCAAQSICSNTAGSRTCGSCAPGYSGDPNVLNGCMDVNECAQNNGGCFAGGPGGDASVCTNTVGSRTCGPCPAGYTGNGITCNPVVVAHCTPAPWSLLAWLRGETDATDSVGGFSGSEIGGAAVTHTPGKVGSAFTLDGIAPGYVSIPPIAAISGNNARTIAFWMKPRADSVAGDQNTAFFFGTPGSPHDAFGIDTDGLSGTGTVLLQAFTWSAGDIAGADTHVLPDQWIHVAATYNPVTTTLVLYANGVLIGAANQAGGLVTSPTSIDFGRFPGGGGVGESFFGGQLDELAIFNRALDSSEIAAMYGAGSAGFCSMACTQAPQGLAHWWSGDVNALDQVGTADATMVGGATLVPGYVRNAFSIGGGQVQILDLPDTDVHEMAFDAWINAFTPAGRDQEIWFFERLGVLRLDNTGRVVFAMPNGETITNTSKPPLAGGTFHHILLDVSRVDAATTIFRVFVDGEVYQTGIMLGRFEPPFGPVAIGGGGESAFAGLVDEVHFFRTALTNSQVRQLYEAGSSGFCPVPPTQRQVVVNYPAHEFIVYGTPLGASQQDATATYNGDTVPGTFVYSPPAGTILNAGDDIPLSVTFTPDDPAFYSGGSADSSIDVHKAPTTITWAQPANILYGTPLGAAQLNAAASSNNTSLAGSFTYSPPAGTILGPGTHPLSVSFDPDSDNYEDATGGTSIVVAQQPPTVTVPANMSVPATSASGAVVSFTATAVDAFGASVTPVTCTPPSGSTFPLGTTPVTCSATDSAGQTGSAGFTVTVGDSTPPVIHSLTPNPSQLWPPNNQWVTVTIGKSVTDNVDPSPACTITSVTGGDYQLGSGLTLDLRASKLNGGARVYTITVKCTDSSGNSASKPTTVTVPKNQNGK